MGWGWGAALCVAVEKTGGDAGDGLTWLFRVEAASKEATRDRTVIPRNEDQSSSV